MHIFLSVVTVLATIGAGAPATLPHRAVVPDLTGTWILDVARSDFGMSPPPDSAITVITRADDRLVMTRRTFTAMAGHGTVRFDMPTDGAMHDATMDNGQMTPASAWWEGDTLVMTLTVHSNVGEIDVTDSMTSSPEGTLEIDRVLSVPQAGELTQRLVLRRRG